MRKIFFSLTSLEIWVVGLFVIASFISERFLLVAVGCSVAFGLIRWVAHGRFSLRTPADWPVLLLILMLPITLWATDNFNIAFIQVLRLLTGIGVYYAIINWTNSSFRVRWLVRGIWAAGLILAIYAFISVQWNSTKLAFIPASIYVHFPVLVNDPANPNVMAGSLILLLPCVLGLLLFCGLRLHWIELGLVGITTVAVVVVLFLTQSRGGLLGLGETLVLMVVLRFRRGWVILTGVCILVGLTIIWLGPMQVLNLIVTNATLGGVDGRLEVWSRAVYMIHDFPFTGVGIGSFGHIADLLYPFFLYASGVTIPHAHNLFLQIAVDLGIPGLVAWLAIWILLTLTAWHLYRHGQVIRDGWVSGLGAGLLCCQFVLVSHGMLDAVTWGMVKTAPLVWVIWGTIVAVGYIHGRKE